jgi:hypothetical protein
VTDAPGTPPDKAVDIATAEFNALRAELASRLQAQTGSVAIALTATAAIGGVAFGGKADRLPILLILPFALGGLGISFVENGHRIQLLGIYIRVKLWPTLRLKVGQLESWEDFLVKYRGRHALHEGLTTYLALGFVPYLLIFGAPAVAGLFVTAVADIAHPAWFWIAWVLGVAVLIGFGYLALSADKDIGRYAGEVGDGRIQSCERGEVPPRV